MINRDDLLKRLQVLRAKLDQEGLHVSVDTLDDAIAELRDLWDKTRGFTDGVVS